MPGCGSEGFPAGLAEGQRLASVSVCSGIVQAGHLEGIKGKVAASESAQPRSGFSALPALSS